MIVYLILHADPGNALKSRFNRSGLGMDIYDGTEYKKLMEPCKFLSTPENVSFCINTDGVRVFKSSCSEIWPIWLQLNELPPAMRYRV